MTNSTIQSIQEKATFLNNLSNNEQSLFEYINSSKPNLNEVIQMYKPHNEFRPVNTLRFLIANELRKGEVVTKALIKELKNAIEARDVSVYYELNDTVNESLKNYKDSKTGMFPNWRHTFKILFPFLHSKVDNEEVLRGLNTIADEIIVANQLQDVHKHIVGFQGAQNYGTDLTWLAIIPKSAPSVQYAYQLFFRIDQSGIKGGIHKGHNLTKQNFDNQDLRFNSWEDYLEHTKQTKSQWSDLNADINFIFMNDEKAFIKTLKKVDRTSVSDYFNTLERFKTDLNIQDEEKLVFSIAKNRLSFQVGKRYCLNLNKTHFDFISNTDIEGDSGLRETFSGAGSTYLYKDRSLEDVLNNYEDIKTAIENEIDRDNHALAKFYDNSAFRKAFFDSEYRSKILESLGIQKIFKNSNMINVKDEFISWLINKPKSNYFNNDKDTLSRYLDIYNAYFDLDLFEVSQSNYKLIIDAIDSVAYQDENSEFFKYSEGESTHRPRAILGKTNYYHFLEQRFNNFNAIVEEPNYLAALNQIFYGPPGTGKTYNTILEAAKIITQNENIAYNEALRIFNNNLGDQIEFITFHQNYSYEDFIQGLRPDVEAGGELSFFKSDGVFKKIADRALKNFRESNTKVQKKRDFSEVFEEFMFPLVEGEVEEIEIKMRKVSFFITNIKDKSIEFRKTSGGTDHTLSIGTLEEMYDKESIKGIKGLASYYRPLLEELLNRGKLNETEHISRKNYVIIIDEINRANISRVFGELITLIEKDKRLGGKIPLTATLPSGEKFIIPSNLYIIGTMNTADKSIALLDIALRRRFEFVPMYPNSESTQDKTVNDADILDAINKEIITRKGHDFTIGHSYFMGEDYELKNTIDNKVIPLLLEYFMNDYEEVKKILCAATITVDGWPMQYIAND